MDIPPRADLGEWARLRARIAVTDRDWVYCGALSDDGYGRFWAASAAPADGRSPVVRPSRWMWQAHYGPIPDGYVVRHDCDRSWCCRPLCLRLGEQADNVSDALRTDRLTHPGRVGKADRRGAGASARAVRAAVLDALGRGVHDPAELGAVVAAVLVQGDPFADHGTLFGLEAAGPRRTPPGRRADEPRVPLVRRPASTAGQSGCQDGLF